MSKRRAAVQTIGWTSQPLTHPRYAKQASPNIVALLAYFKVLGWVNLGNFGVRTVRGGSAPSAHAFGAAQDLGYGKLTRLQVDANIDFIVAQAELLGVQEVHDYAALRVWKWDRRSDVKRGWKSQALGSHGGGMDPSSRWIHIETSLSDFDNATPVEQRLVGATASAPAPQRQPVGVTDFATLPTLHPGDIDPQHVALLQSILRDRAGQPVGKSDGIFGPKTTKALRNVQAWLGLPTDGVVDQLDWEQLAKLDPEAFKLAA
jgi:peptidoglycan hydrolase-like protein with peptidoglycan-binding domain